MDEVTGMLQKIRTLAVQSANGTNTAEDRAALNKEANALAQEINRIAGQTKFGGKTVLDGAGNGDDIYGAPAGGAPGAGGGKADKGTLTLQVGANKGDTISFEVNSMRLSAMAAVAGIGFDTVWNKDKSTALLSDATKIDGMIEGMDKLIAAVDSQRAGLGALQNRLESSIRNQANVSANQADARSRIRDADFAEESANLSQQSIIQQAATSMLMQANTRPQLGLSLLG